MRPQILPLKHDFKPGKTQKADTGADASSFYLSQIGDHEGGNGFYTPMMSAAGAGSRLGMPAAEIITRITETARTADRSNHTPEEVADRIAKVPAAVASFQAKDAQELRGWDGIDPMVAEEPKEQLTVTTPEAAKRRLEEELRKILENCRPVHCLVKGAMGLGKTDAVIKLIVANTVRRTITSMATSGQIVYVAQRHDLLEDAAKKLRECLRDAGWSSEKIAENVVILRGRDQGAEPLCQRSEEAKLVADNGGSVGQSLCRRPATKTRPEVLCPFFAACKWQKVKRQSAEARFVLMTHAHLTSPWPPVSTPGVFHPQNAQLVIVDEDPISTMFDQKVKRIKVGTFAELVPELGAKIEEALAQPETLDWLRAEGVTAEQLYIAAERRKRREGRRRIGHPGMTLDERKAVVTQSKERPRPEKLSRWLTHLADELKSGRPGECFSLRRDSETGEIMARGRKQLWETGHQTWIVLDGTAEVEDLRLFLPKIQEVRIDVPRNAIIVQVTTNTYSKNSTIANGQPTELLTAACKFIEILAKAFPQGPEEDGVAVFTTKEIRKVLTGESADEKLEVSTPFRDALLGHYGNVKGSNNFEKCEVGVLIGRGERPVKVIEDETRALHYDTPTPIKFSEALWLDHKSAPYTVRDGRVVLGRSSRHPDPRAQRRNWTTREAEELQAIDRLRLIHNQEPKLIFILCSLPLPLPVDILITEEMITKMVELKKLLEMRGLQDAASRTMPLTGAFLAETWPGSWTAKGAEDWLRAVFPEQDQWVPETLLCLKNSNKKDTIRDLRSQEGLKIFLLRQVLDQTGWALARFRLAGTKAAEWSLFLYRPGLGAAGVRTLLAGDLKIAQPEQLSLSTLDGEPFPGTTGDALLDQALAICGERGLALPLDPKPLATLPGSPWPNAKVAENWKSSQAASGILERGPPHGWAKAEYRLTSRRGGRASVAWIPPGVSQVSAIAKVLGVPESTVALRRPVLPQPRLQPWIKSLSFAAMLRPDEGTPRELLTPAILDDPEPPIPSAPQATKGLA
jgi:hypothetical protein